MITLLNPRQIRACREAKAIFDNIAAISELRPMFRREGDDLSVALCLSEAGHHFIVRQTVHLGGVHEDDVEGVCLDLLATIGDMHARVLSRPVAIVRPM